MKTLGLHRCSDLTVRLTGQIYKDRAFLCIRNRMIGYATAGLDWGIDERPIEVSALMRGTADAEIGYWPASIGLYAIPVSGMKPLLN